jgi:hypothetical protein
MLSPPALLACTPTTYNLDLVGLHPSERFGSEVNVSRLLVSPALHITLRFEEY